MSPRTRSYLIAALAVLALVVIPFTVGKLVKPPVPVSKDGMPDRKGELSDVFVFDDGGAAYDAWADKAELRLTSDPESYLGRQNPRTFAAWRVKGTESAPDYIVTICVVTVDDRRATAWTSDPIVMHTYQDTSGAALRSLKASVNRLNHAFDPEHRKTRLIPVFFSERESPFIDDRGGVKDFDTAIAMRHAVR